MTPLRCGVEEPLSRMGGRARWVMAWETESQANRIRGRAYASRLMASDWEVVERGGLVLGSKPFVPTQTADLTPGEMDARISGCISLLGSGLSADAMCDAPFVESMRAFATTHRLEPSREFLEGLTPLRSALQYQAEDARGRSGMVIVSSVPLGDLIEELASAGRIVEVHRGASASAVWQ